jgi:hypothetical protein
MSGRRAEVIAATSRDRRVFVGAFSSERCEAVPMDETTGPLSLTVTLLFDDPVEIDARMWLAAIGRILPGSVLVGDADETPVLVAHPGIGGGGVDPAMPLQTSLVVLDAVPELDLDQAWDAAHLESRALAAAHGVTLVELVGGVPAVQERVQVFHAALCAAVEILDPVAVWSPHAAKLVDPADVAAYELEPLVNVRLFEVEDEPGAMVMDTLGLHVLGLPDIQCHFVDLDTDAVAAHLYDTAAYVFEEGDVLGDGHSVDGIDDGPEWTCRHEESLVEPLRDVLDLDPGPPHAGGGRD